MLTIGICNDETSSACLFKNGELLAAVSEERFTRVKMDKSFPLKSIKFLLKKFNRGLNDINIAYSWAKGFDPELIEYYLNRFLICNDVSQKNVFLEKIKFDKIRDEKGRKIFNEWFHQNCKNCHLTTVYHHEAHAASCSLLSDFDNGICLTVDGVGDFESLGVWRFDRKNILHPLQRIYSSTSSDSLGYFYGRIAGLLGFTPMRHEGKVTGLAAHGDPNKALNLMREMIIFKDGILKSNLGDLYKPYFKPYSKKLIERISEFKKEDIAAAAQKHLEEILTNLIIYIIEKNNIKKTNLMCAGGVFSNVKLTQKLKEIPNINNIFVQPQMGDGGLCLGAAAISQHREGLEIKPMRNVFLGPDIDLKEFINKYGTDTSLKIKKIKDLKNIICNDLNNNLVIGLVRGKMEFGPRSLCHRSIICRTSNSEINSIINKRLGRNEFMPFAPVMREEVAEKELINFNKDDITLEYMTSTINCSKNFSIKSPAVVHIDETARPQIIKKNKDKFMWELLYTWEKVSSELSLVNTSFNSHEEPIICYPDEAINALKKNIVDVIFIEDYRIVSKA